MPRRAYTWPAPVRPPPSATAEERAMLAARNARLRERLAALRAEREAIDAETREIEMYLRVLAPLLVLEGLPSQPPAEGATEG